MELMQHPFEHPRLAKTVQNLIRISHFCRVGDRETLVGLQCVGTGHKACVGEKGGLDTIGRSHAGMKRFAHCPELCAQTRGARCDQPEGVFSAPHVKPKQSR